MFTFPPPHQFFISLQSDEQYPLSFSFSHFSITIFLTCSIFCQSFSLVSNIFFTFPFLRNFLQCFFHISLLPLLIIIYYMYFIPQCSWQVLFSHSLSLASNIYFLYLFPLSHFLSVFLHISLLPLLIIYSLFLTVLAKYCFVILFFWKVIFSLLFPFLQFS